MRYIDGYWPARVGAPWPGNTVCVCVGYAPQIPTDLPPALSARLCRDQCDFNAACAYAPLYGDTRLRAHGRVQIAEHVPLPKAVPWGRPTRSWWR